MSWLRQIVVALAIAAVSTQGIATGTEFVVCHDESDAAATHSHADHGATGHEQNHESHSDHGGAGTDNGQQGCCHLTASGLPSLPLAIPTRPFSVLVSGPMLLHDLFVPDRPQRPPLS